MLFDNRHFPSMVLVYSPARLCAVKCVSFRSSYILRLEQMTEKEREQELFNRIEQREVLKTRFEIERKLKKAKEKEQKRKEKKEGKKEKSSSLASSPGK